MKCSSLNALPARESDKKLGCKPPRRPSKPTPAPPKNAKGKERAREDHDTPKAPTQEQPSRSSSPDAPQEPAQTTETGRPKQHTKVPKQPGNVYGDKHPAQIKKEIRKQRDWSRIVSERPWSKGNKESEPVPGPSSPPPERSPSPKGTSSGSEDNDEVEKSLKPSSDDESEDAALARLCREGGVKFQTFLISKAVSPTPMEKSPREWKYRDITKLPKAELEEWRTACNQELEALHRHQVYDLEER